MDSASNIVDFLLTRQRDVKVARRFFKQSIRPHPYLLTVKIDKSGAYRNAVDGFKALLQKCGGDKLIATFC